MKSAIKPGQYLLVLCLGLSLLTCRPETDLRTLELSFSEISVPADSFSMFPSLTFTHEGELILTWLYEPDTLSHLMMARLDKEGNWSAPIEIASGSEWFINWADFPALAAQENGRLLTYSLPKSSDDTYAYDVGLYQSTDNGQTWTGPIIPHHDKVEAEHGFVSFLTLGEGKIGAVWLDGRNYGKVDEDGHNGQDSGGEPDMTLRFATIDEQGNIADDYELDPKVCSCCQTDAALLPNGAIVVYRDRSEEEIRDISYVRLLDGRWTEPKTLGEDLWEIAGCPVNGPGVSTYENKVAVNWYTEAGGKSQVKMAISQDGGEHFSDPIRLDKGEPIGRVDVRFWNEGHILASWVEQESDRTAAVRYTLLDTEGNTVWEQRVTDIDPNRTSGFPRMAVFDETGYLAWTKTGPKPVIKMVRIF